MSADLCVSTIRVLSADIVQKANSGHPGAPMGMAPMAHVMWNKVMKFNPKNANWANRDRFVLSNGHASALLYTMLHLTGYPTWTIDVLQTFRQLHSPAAGHPENHFPGIEVTTGPLGQGISNAVGLAIAEAHMAQKFNKDGLKLVDHYTYVFCGDGCLQEGVSSEASSLAGHLGLGKLIVLYDDNSVTIDGPTNLSFSEDVLARYESYGWHTLKVASGDTDVEGIEKAIAEAQKVTDKPTLIKVTTTIGFGSSKAGGCGVHGSPLGEADLEKVKEKFGLDPKAKFQIPDDAKKVFDATERGAKYEEEWNKVLAEYTAKHPTEAAEFKRRVAGQLPEGWDKNYPVYTPKDPAAATRTLSGQILNHFANIIPDVFGGSADLNPSTFTYLKSDKDFLKGHYDQRNVRFGIREHGMAAICNGIAAYGGFVPFCSTFLNFIGYAYGAVILSALSRAHVLYVFTHDSIYLGEDGPTHQPIEKYLTCRATPHLHFWRPADGNETVAAYVSAIQSNKNPTVMSLTRQNLPHLEGSSVEKALKGGYIVHDCGCANPDVVLVSTGSEVNICVSAAQQIKDFKIRVVSLPCWELFDAQPLEYRKSVLGSTSPVLSVEAACTAGWERYAHGSIGIDVFGESAPGGALAKHFQLRVEDIVAKAQKFHAWAKTATIVSRLDVPEL